MSSSLWGQRQSHASCLWVIQHSWANFWTFELCALLFFALENLNWNKSWLVPEFFCCELPVVTPGQASPREWRLLFSSILVFTASVFPLEFKLLCSGCSLVCALLPRCVWLCVTLWGIACLEFLCPWAYPGKNTGVGCHFLLQRIFPIQGLNPRLLLGRRILLLLLAFKLIQSVDYEWVGGNETRMNVWLPWKANEDAFED